MMKIIALMNTATLELIIMTVKSAIDKLQAALDEQDRLLAKLKKILMDQNLHDADALEKIEEAFYEYDN